MALWKLMSIIGIASIIFVGVVIITLMFIFSPSTGNCVERALDLDLPCMRGTIMWNGVECQCTSTTVPHQEIEFRSMGDY